MGLLRKIGKKIGKLFPGTGRHAARRAADAANAYALEAQAKTVELEEKAKKERRKAQKLALRGMRSKRAASHFANQNAEYTSYGSPTIG